MRNTLFALAAALVLASANGCCHHWAHHGGEKFNGGCEEGCGYCGPNRGACGPGGCPSGYGENGCCGQGDCAQGGPCRCCPCSPVPDCYNDHRYVASQIGGPAGPPSPQVTYPYYTVRGPRDFLAAHPPTIGP